MFPARALGSSRPDFASRATSATISAPAWCWLFSASPVSWFSPVSVACSLLVCVPAFGFFLPRFFLKRMIKDRQQRIRIALPDALDLTVICVEAGLALDQALMRVGQDLHHAHPDLSDEFHLVNLEMRAGKPRAEALRNLVDRTGVDDIRSLVGTLIQTDRFGTSVAQALRVHSDSLRTARRQRAEEQAAKTTIKMVPPLVIFILVPFLFVTVGPALIQAYHSLVSK